MLKKVLISVIAFVIAIVVFTFVYASLNKSPEIFEASVGGLYHKEARISDKGSLVSTETGQVIGFSDAYDSYAWLGIPYAKAPIDDLRWRAPQGAEPWGQTLEATNYGNPCIQFWGLVAGIEGNNGEVIGDENCLSLNIWAPKSALLADSSGSQAKLPVMYWIHGGGNDSGTGMVYQGHHLAGTKDVIVVTINYRLGMLGWFSHDAIRANASTPEDASGNFGTLDIIQGLKWVQNNISKFGGDPNNVTVFGESAGGRNVYSLLASPLAKGLFHRAISQSGTPDTTVLTLAEDFDDKKLIDPVSGLKNSSNGLISLMLSEENPEQSKQTIREKIATSNPAELLKTLRSVPAEKMMMLAAKNVDTIGYIKTANVLRDGYVLPKESTLKQLNSTANYNSVPLMLGSNRDEQKLFMMRNPRYVKNWLGVLPRPKDEAYYNRVSKYVSDNWKAGAVDEPANIISKTNAPNVYGYRFDWDESPSNFLADLPTLIGAAHGLEMSFVFGDFTGGVPLGALLDKKNAQGRKELSLTMMDYWAAFAHNGKPGKGLSGQQPEWSPWSTSGKNLMVLDTQADGGHRMQEVRNTVADIKAQLPNDEILIDPKERCEAYAVLFLHGYQSSDFWNPREYSELGCDEFPAGEFRQS